MKLILATKEGNIEEIAKQIAISFKQLLDLVKSFIISVFISCSYNNKNRLMNINSS